MKYEVSTAPTAEPVSLADAKMHLRTITGDTSEDSAIITPLIQAAREYCENITGRALAAQTVKAYPESWGLWRLPRPPIVSIASIKHYDEDNAEHALASADYQLDTADGLVYILTPPGASLRALNPIVIEYTCGYATGNAIPMAIRQAMLLLIGHWYMNREAVATGAVTTVEVDMATRALLRQYKVWWF